MQRVQQLFWYLLGVLQWLFWKLSGQLYQLQQYLRTGTCIGTCTGQCNTACTAEAQAEEIANLGLNIAVGNPIKASDYTQLKAAIDREYTRRGKGTPTSFPVPPQPKGKVLLSTARKVLEDLYALDGLPEHDWRDSFSSGTVVPPSKWAPSIAYLKTLAAEIV